MSSLIRQAASFQSPDSSQVVGDLTVTNPSTTGHDPSTSGASNASVVERTCRWFSFETNPLDYLMTRVRLQFSWSEGGFTDGGSNRFHVQYTVDGGSNWVDVFDHTNINASSGASVDIVLPLPASKNLGLVQVRDRIRAAAALESVCDCTGAISGLQLEVALQSPQVIVMM